MQQTLNGALIGWRHIEAEDGLAIRLQLAASAAEATHDDSDRVTVVVSRGQLGSFIRSLNREATRLGVRVDPQRSRWHNFLAGWNRLGQRSKEQPQ